MEIGSRIKSQPGGRDAIIKIRVGANTPPQVVTYTADSAPPRWSPQDDWIAFSDLNRMRIVRSDGTEERTVSQRKWQTYGWSQDGSSLYGIAVDDNRRLMLGRLSLAGGRERKIADLGGRISIGPPAFWSFYGRGDRL